MDAWDVMQAQEKNALHDLRKGGGMFPTPEEEPVSSDKPGQGGGGGLFDYAGKGLQKKDVEVHRGGQTFKSTRYVKPAEAKAEAPQGGYAPPGGEMSFGEYVKWSQALVPGDNVMLYWTSSGRHYHGRAKLTVVNAKSVSGVLLHPVGEFGQTLEVPDKYGYDKGQVITAPLDVTAKTQKPFVNAVMPIGLKKFKMKEPEEEGLKEKREQTYKAPVAADQNNFDAMHEKKKKHQVDVANTIYKQIGGKAFVMMTGARRFMAITDGLAFALPYNFAKDGINKVVIKLMPTDTYKMEFWRIGRAPGFKENLVATDHDIYVESLRSIISHRTGLKLWHG
jgi:hypothetical protein